jgi:hypothetical protein
MRKIILAKRARTSCVIVIGSSKDVIDDTSTIFLIYQKVKEVFLAFIVFFLYDYFGWCKLCFGDAQFIVTFTISDTKKVKSDNVSMKKRNNMSLKLVQSDQKKINQSRRCKLSVM